VDDIERKREELKKVYPSASFKEKANKMSAAQVIAMYNRLKKQGKI
jgi:hypothetical protein